MRVAAPAPVEDASTDASERDALVARVRGSMQSWILGGVGCVIATGVELPLAALARRASLQALRPLVLLSGSIVAFVLLAVLLHHLVATALRRVPLREVEGTLWFDGRRWWLTAQGRSRVVARTLHTPLTVGPGRGQVFPWLPLAIGCRSAVPAEERLPRAQAALDAYFGVGPVERDALAEGQIPGRVAARLRQRSRLLSWTLASTSVAVLVGILAGSAAGTVFAALTGGLLSILACVSAPPGSFDHPSRLRVQQFRGPARAHARFEQRARELLRIEELVIGAHAFRTTVGYARILAPGDLVRGFVSIPNEQLLALEVVSQASGAALGVPAEWVTSPPGLAATLDAVRREFEGGSAMSRQV